MRKKAKMNKKDSAMNKKGQDMDIMKGMPDKQLEDMQRTMAENE